MKMGDNMEQLNEEMIRSVWQRVQAEQAAVCPEAFSGREEALRRSLLRLSSRYTGQQQAQLRKMAAQCAQAANVLRGMCILGSGQKPVNHGSVKPDALLRRCYGELMALLRAYEQRATDPQFGPVFSGLARQKQQQCHQLLALAGKR